MAGHDLVIHVFHFRENVDARHKAEHDERETAAAIYIKYIA